MAERTAMLIDHTGEPVGVEGNPLYIGGIVSVGSLVELTDVEIVAPASGDYIGYDADTGKYVNKPVIESGTGDVTGPASTTENKIPQWDATTKKLKDGLPIGTTANTIAAGDDSRFTNPRTPVAHNLIDTTGHPVTGLTTGHFLKATGATAYGFGAHGLTAPDVGAQAADATLTALAGVTTAADKVPYFTNTDTAAVFDLPSNPNLIQNGGFQVNQRKVASVNQYGAWPVDRWALYIGSSSIVVSQQTFTPGQADVPGEPKNYLRCVTSATGDYGFVNHSIESVRTLAGQSAVLSFWAKADAAKSFAVYYTQVFGTGGSAAVSIDPITVTLSNTWAKYTIPVTIPSISGKTIGAAGDDLLGVKFNINVATGTFEFANVKLEAGTVATPFVQKPYAEELKDCQKHNLRIPASSAFMYFGFGYAGSTTVAYIQFPLPAPLRTSPTITFGGTIKLAPWGATVTSIGLSSVGTSAIVFYVESSGLTTSGAAAMQAGNDTTAYINLSAEL